MTEELTCKHQMIDFKCKNCGLKVVILDNNPVSVACYLEEYGDKYDI